MPRWTEELIVQALRRFEVSRGRRPTTADLAYPVPRGYPGTETIRRVCGSFANASVLAFGEAQPQGGQNSKDEDTEAVLDALRAGSTLTIEGRKRGISGQALGRRVRRYCRTYGVEYPKLPLGNAARRG